MQEKRARASIIMVDNLRRFAMMRMRMIAMSMTMRMRMTLFTMRSTDVEDRAVRRLGERDRCGMMTG